MTVIIDAATLNDIGLIKAIASRYSSELGYVMYPALRESVHRGELTVARAPSGSPCGFVNWHMRRDGWTTIYEIAVAPGVTRQGIGKLLIDAVPRPTRLKCTVNNVSANAFYLSTGFTLAGIDPGKKRALNIWERT